MKNRVYIFDEFNDCVSGSWIDDISNQILSISRDNNLIGDDVDTILDIVVADDVAVTLLNSKYRGLDETTDVLAFSFIHDGIYYGKQTPVDRPQAFEFIMPDDHVNNLGELIISYEEAQRQAERFGIKIGDELMNLLIHGILHLIGYDHMEENEELEMKAIERSIRMKIDLHE